MAKAARLFLKVDLLKHELRDDLDAMVEQDRQRYGEMTPSEFVRNLIRQEKTRRKQLAIYNSNHGTKHTNTLDVLKEVLEDSPMQEC